VTTQPHHPLSQHADAAVSVESLSEAIRVLAAERQVLRAQGADPERLELNRLELVRHHQQLAHALIERHLPRPTESPAAA
jgi:hypothetical protein